MTTTHRVGLIVNPIAGMGGAVGLAGTDGERLAEAIARGARPLAAARAGRALRVLAGSGQDAAARVEVLTAAGDMGEEAALAAGLTPRIVYEPAASRSRRADTVAAARALLAAGIDLLLVAGGDGTARDLLEPVGDRVPVLGIPAGVKMHSAVFAPGPGAAGDIARAFLAAGCPAERLRDAEVMDRELDPGGQASPELYGTLRVPAGSQWLPHPKASPGDDARLEGACAWAARLARDELVTLIGPGATMQAVKARLGFDGTLLGVDAVCEGRLLAADLGERQIIDLLAGRQGRIIVSIVGGQGFLFGRGNQQLGPAVIRAVGRERIVIVAALGKLAALGGGPLIVDTGDAVLDSELSGFMPVRVGARQAVQYRVVAADAADGAGPAADRVADAG